MTPPAQGGGQQEVPFLLGSNIYTEAPFFTFTQQMDGSQHTVLPVPQVTPGNFLDGITVSVTSTGGVLGTTASVNAFGGASLLNSIEFLNTIGGEILSPMGSFEYILAQKYLRPSRLRVRAQVLPPELPHRVQEQERHEQGEQVRDPQDQLHAPDPTALADLQIP